MSARSIVSVLVAATTAMVACLCTARAGDLVFHGFDPPKTYTGEVGVRLGYGRGNTGKSLFDPSGASMVSRLSYDGMSIFSAEAYGRFDIDTGWFVKGMLGGGPLHAGSLKDEDFPPLTSPYSATLSVINNSSLFYGTADVGYNVIRGGDFRLGAFVGYHNLYETTQAIGCNQIASNTDICGTFPVPGTFKVITQDNDWSALRVGLNGAVDMTGGLRLELDAAYLPWVWLSGTDTHWLRISNQLGDFSGPIPEDGKGWGYQLEGVLSYQVTNSISVGVGGRYWHMQTSGFSHFEGHINGFLAFPQPVNWHTDNFGVFLQTGFKFGPKPIISGGT